jgi:hypothetical protein
MMKKMYHCSTPHVKVGVREWEMRRIDGVDETVFGFTTGLFVTHPLSSERLDVVVMRNVGRVNIGGLGRLGKRCDYHGI